MNTIRGSKRSSFILKLILILICPFGLSAQECLIKWTNLAWTTSFSGTTLTKTGPDGVWNAGGISTIRIPENADGYLIYEVVDSSKYTSIGLADMDVNYRPDSIDFKFLFTHDPYYFDRHVQVYAPGARLDSYDGEVTYSLGDRFKISRVGSTIYYQKYDFGNSVWSTLYTASAYLPTGSQNLPELMVDCSMSKHGGVITDAKISCFSYVRLKDNLDGSYYKCTGGRLGLIVEEEYFVDDAVLNLKIYDKSRTVVYTNTGELISTGVKNYSIDLAAAGGFTNNEFYTVEVVTAKDRKRFVRIQYQD